MANASDLRPRSTPVPQCACNREVKRVSSRRYLTGCFGPARPGCAWLLGLSWLYYFFFCFYCYFFITFVRLLSFSVRRRGPGQSPSGPASRFGAETLVSLHGLAVTGPYEPPDEGPTYGFPGVWPAVLQRQTGSFVWKGWPSRQSGFLFSFFSPRSAQKLILFIYCKCCC